MPHSDDSPAAMDVIRGPVGLKFQTFEEANAYYMDYNFLGWKEKAQTYVVPPVYKIHSKEAPHWKASNFVPFQKDIEASDLEGQVAEEEILKAFVDYGYLTAQPMFIFHNFDFKDLGTFGRNRLKLQMNMTVIQKETDLIVVHRDFGIILVETKSTKKFTSKTYSHAKEELRRAEKQLFDNPYFELPPDARTCLKKVIACPFLQGKPIQSCKVSCEYTDLRQNHLSHGQFSEWWDKMIQVQFATATNDQASLCHEIYYNLVPKLLCGRGDICVCLNIAETAAQLDSQESLENLALREYKIKGDTRMYLSSKVGSDTFVLEKKWLYLTPEQCQVWKKEKQVICGPYGSGKTLLLQCKAAALACMGEQVLVIVPFHLVEGYKKFFNDNIAVESSNLKLVSKEEFCEHFDYCKRLAWSSHVFVDELLWPYWEESTESLEGSSSTSQTSLEGLCCLDEWMSDESETEPVHVQSISASMSDSSLEGLSNIERWMLDSIDPEDTCCSAHSVHVMSDNDNLGAEATESVLSQSSSISVSDSSLEGLCNCERWMSDPESTPSLTHSVNVEQVHSGHLDEIGVPLVNFLLSLFKDKDRSQCLWIVPHLYIIIRQQLFYSSAQTGEVHHFIAQLEELPISSLNTIMRTCKQVHNFKVKKEWQEFCDCIDGEESLDCFLEHMVFRMVFVNFLGHSVSGPPVKTVLYPSHCRQYSIPEKHPNQKIIDHFHHFSARVLQAEIDQILRDPPAIELIRKGVFETSKIPGSKPTIEPRDIVIVGDSSESNLDLVLIKELLKGANFTLCSVKEHQEGKNAIPICYSCDIASLEWPVVLHVQAKRNQQLHYRKGSKSPGMFINFPFFEGDQSVITSRCMVYYIHIRREDDDIESHGYRSSYELETDDGAIQDIETLFAKKVRPKLSAFDKVHRDEPDQDAS